ncbi:MAG: DUF4097 family beta strand repeat-containing protein [Acidimicrobiia bacterium]|nr:DUF4097 family beta strand repeat-containing protein [Acidimicrobiia bacterium]
MSERTERFEVDGRPDVTVRIPTGHVRLVPSDDGAVLVRLSGSERDLDRFRIDQRGRHITVETEKESFGIRLRLSGVDVGIALPPDADVEVRVASGDLRSDPVLRTLSVDAASGDIAVEGEVTRDLSVKAASGDVRVESVGGSVDVSLASGDVLVRSVDGPCRIVSASGNVRVGHLTGPGSFKSASGDVSVAHFGGDHFDAKTMSGDVSIGVPGGRRYEVSFKALSGDVRTDFPISSEKSSGTSRLNVTSLSGDITVHAAE